LDGFPRDDQEYLVVSAEYRLFDPGYRSHADVSENFKAILGLAPTALPYRRRGYTTADRTRAADGDGGRTGRGDIHRQICR
jgi:hypothetical protein